MRIAMLVLMVLSGCYTSPREAPDVDAGEPDAGSLAPLDASGEQLDAAPLDAQASPDAQPDACAPFGGVDPSPGLTFRLVSGSCPALLTYSDLTDWCEASSDPRENACAFEQEHMRCVFDGLRFDAAQRVTADGWRWVLALDGGKVCVYE